MHSLFLARRDPKPPTIVVVFHGDAIQRMMNHDPAVLEGSQITERLLQGLPIPLAIFDWLFCYEESQEAFVAKCKALGGDTRKIVAWLGRNWEHRSEDEIPITPYEDQP